MVSSVAEWSGPSFAHHQQSLLAELEHFLHAADQIETAGQICPGPACGMVGAQLLLVKSQRFLAELEGVVATEISMMARQAVHRQSVSGWSFPSTVSARDQNLLIDLEGVRIPADATVADAQLIHAGNCVGIVRPQDQPCDWRTLPRAA